RSGRRGRKFESCHSDQFWSQKSPEKSGLFCDQNIVLKVAPAIISILVKSVCRRHGRWPNDEVFYFAAIGGRDLVALAEKIIAFAC
ncbi:MAG: hypothetical protein PHT48_00875, partial [Dechloromonas sp.]|nr:hypothetical protein [Dechloromonas sp.]